MIKIDLTCYIKGNNFSETDIADNSGMVIHSVKEKEIIKKNIPIRAFKKVVSIIPEENGIIEDDYPILITTFSKFINEKLKTIKQRNWEKIVLLITIKYKDQCNLQFENRMLKLLSKTFDQVYITCYDIEND